MSWPLTAPDQVEDTRPSIHGPRTPRWSRPRLDVREGDGAVSAAISPGVQGALQVLFGSGALGPRIVEGPRVVREGGFLAPPVLNPRQLAFGVERPHDRKDVTAPKLRQRRY